VAPLHGLVGAGGTVAVVEHDVHVIAGSDGGDRRRPRCRRGRRRVVAVGPTAVMDGTAKSRTASYLARLG
jgi:excinuclease ABC subunit A